MGLEESYYSFFVKMLPSSHIHYNDRGKFIAQRTGAFKREIESNFCFLPQLNKFVKNAGSQHSVIQTPEIVYGSHDVIGNGVIVWINETASHGFQPTPHARGLNLTELSCVVCKLAQFHAAATAFLMSGQSMAEYPHISSGVDIDEIERNNEEECSKLVLEMSNVFKDFNRFVRRLPGHLHAYKACDRLRPSFVGTMLRSIR